MRRFSAQYVITNNGPLLKRAVITTTDDGTITAVEDTGGNLRETSSTEFHNGIIVPGFVNCHCHLELSHMKGVAGMNTGLAGFIARVRTGREAGTQVIEDAASSADTEMYRNGISLCADICNTPVTFSLKHRSRISYINLIEVFGIDPAGAGRRIDEALRVAAVAEELGLAHQVVPHSAYSLSVPLFRKLRELASNNTVTSIHFMESESEKELLEKHSGLLMDEYLRSGLLKGEPDLPAAHGEVILNLVTPSGNLILVHNVHADRADIRSLAARKNLYWCLCPSSNMYIGGKMPPVALLREEGCDIVIGTDSLASNSSLDILHELKLIAGSMSDHSLAELVRWATINGARALGRDDIYGTIEPGRRPGLVLLENTDLHNLKITPGTTASRLI